MVPLRWVLALVIVVVWRPAAAQRVVEAEGTVNLGFTQTTSTTFQADPFAEEMDRRTSTSSRVFTELRPTIAVQSGTARTLWRLAYQLSGNLAPSSPIAYTNQANASIASQATSFTLFSLSASAAQGGTQYLIGQRPADTGQPELRAPGNQSIVTATLGESINTDLTPRMTLSQSLLGSINASQADLGQYSAVLGGTLGVDRAYRRDNIGIDVRGTLASLQPLLLDGGRTTHEVITVIARWNRDLSPDWNGSATLGAEQVYSSAGSEPLAFTPIGSATAMFTGGDHGFAFEASHGTASNLQVGTISFTTRAAARGQWTIDRQRQRALSYSLGVLHNTPIGEADARVAAGIGSAVNVDLGFRTAVTKSLLLDARYSVAYQFGQAAGLDSALAHLVSIGMTARYSNIDDIKINRPRPARGRRVDRSDGLFPVIDEPVVEP